MTIVAIASLKGAPGVTTLSCLVAATWPSEREVVLVEGDPNGGDMAARFGLSTKRGWSSFAAASRRLKGIEPITAHVQPLPGGLRVMVGTRLTDSVADQRTICSLLSSVSSDQDEALDMIVDIGRLLPGELGVDLWLERSTAVAIVLRRDAASILHVRDRGAVLRSRCHGRVGLVLVGPGPFPNKEVERFTELPVLAELPDDPQAAQIAGGHPGGPSRLSRSLLVLSSKRLAATLSGLDRSQHPEKDERVEEQGSAELPVGTPVEPDDIRLPRRLKMAGHRWRRPWAVAAGAIGAARSTRRVDCPLGGDASVEPHRSFLADEPASPAGEPVDPSSRAAQVVLGDQEREAVR